MIINNRQSANFSSSGHPVRPPRRKKRPEPEYGDPQRIRRSEAEEGSFYGTAARARPVKTDGRIYGAPQQRPRVGGDPDKIYATPHRSRSSAKAETIYRAPATTSRTVEIENQYNTDRSRQDRRQLRQDKDNQDRRSSHYGTPTHQQHQHTRVIEINGHYGSPKRTHVGSENQREAEDSRGRSARATEAEHRGGGGPGGRNVTEKYYFGHSPATVAKTPRVSGIYQSPAVARTTGHHSHYQEPAQLNISSTKYYHNSGGDIYSIHRTESPQNHHNSGGDIYSIHQSRSKAYRTESPSASPSMKYKTKIVLNATS